MSEQAAKSISLDARYGVRTTAPHSIRTSCTASLLFLVLLAPAWSIAAAQAPNAQVTDTQPVASQSALPDAPSSSRNTQSSGFAGGLGTAVKTIGSDEWHFLKYPFQKKAIVWDILVGGATGVLIANDESVLHQVPQSWHNSSLNISNAALGATAATAGGIYLTGLLTHNDHAEDTGVRTAEATIDSVIMYGAMKAIFARQRPFTGEGEGKFFSGNWTNGSFPSGHAMFTWTIASTVAHEYHSPWVKVLMYGLATTVSTTRVTSRQHFPSDVFVGSVFGYGIGAYVAGKDKNAAHAMHSQNRIKRVQNAVLEHVTLGGE